MTRAPDEEEERAMVRGKREAVRAGRRGLRGWPAAVAAGAVVAGVTARSPGAGYWGTYQGDAAHSGYVPVTLPAESLSLAWQKSLGTTPLNPVAAADGRVFASQATRFGDGGLFALDAGSGAELWRYSGFGSVNSVNPPAYAEGKVYIQTGKGTTSPGPYLYAFNATSGSMVFNASYAAQWESYLAPTPYGGNVYVDGGYYGGMYSFNGTTGQQNWFGIVPQYDDWTPAVDGTYAYAYTGSGSTTPIRGVFTVLNLSTGATAASVVDTIFNWTGYSMYTAVTLGTSHDAFTINGGRLVCWDTTLDATHTPHIAWTQTGGYAGQPTVAKGLVYVRNGTTLNVFNELTGDVVWQWSPGAALTGTMIVTDTDLFVQTAGMTYALDLSSHHVVWSYPISGALALSEGRLFVAGSNGTLTAFVVPEPASCLLLGGGLAALGLGRRGRREDGRARDGERNRPNDRRVFRR